MKSTVLLGLVLAVSGLCSCAISAHADDACNSHASLAGFKNDKHWTGTVDIAADGSVETGNGGLSSTTYTWDCDAVAKGGYDVIHGHFTATLKNTESVADSTRTYADSIRAWGTDTFGANSGANSYISFGVTAQGSVTGPATNPSYDDPEAFYTGESSLIIDPGETATFDINPSGSARYMATKPVDTAPPTTGDN